jgi:hypothetical protein
MMYVFTLYIGFYIINHYIGYINFIINIILLELGHANYMSSIEAFIVFFICSTMWCLLFNMSIISTLIITATRND